MSLSEIVRQPHFIVTWVIFIACEIAVLVTGLSLQWQWLLLYGVFFISLSPYVSDAKIFYKGGVTETATDCKSAGILTFSAFITWIFAKSIQNCAKLGAKYGVTGGFAYAGWYTAFFSASAVIYMLRKKGYHSLPQAIHERYGTLALISFAMAVLYRLYQEIWSNAVVIADFYGEYDPAFKSDAFMKWILAATLSVAIPMCYVILGGMRSSLVSDSIQAILALVLLVGTLGKIGTELSGNDALREYLMSCTPGGNDIFEHPGFKNWNRVTNYQNATGTCANPEGHIYEPQQSMMSVPGGLDLMIVGALQGLLSYPFFDPVLTDRCFMTTPKMMARCFTVGGSMAALFIVFFSLIGVYGNQLSSCVCTTWGTHNGTTVCAEYGPCADSAMIAEYGSTLAPYFRGAKLYNVYQGVPADVGRTFGDGLFSVINLIMMSSGISTLDSTFSSLAKLAGPDIYAYFTHGRPGNPEEATPNQVLAGRIMIVVVALCGLLTMLQDPAELSATTVSGTVVMGIGPPIYMLALLPGKHTTAGSGWNKPLAFLVPFWSGVIMGIVYSLKSEPCCKDAIDLSPIAVGGDNAVSGKKNGYAQLLGLNIVGAVVCLVLYFMFSLEWCWFSSESKNSKSGDDDDTSEYGAPIKADNIETTLQPLEYKS